MNTYNFIYTYKGIECQIDINANSEIEAYKIARDCIPEEAFNLCII